MPLSIHELIHFTLSLLAAYIASFIMRRYLFRANRRGGPIRWGVGVRETRYQALIMLAFALAGGLFVDADHLFDYIVAYGFDFDIRRFFTGIYFLVNQKIYEPFHAWEWVAVLILLVIPVLRKKIWKSYVLALALGLAFHLAFDTYVNHVTTKGYFITYRIIKKFEIKDLVTEEHYQEFLKQRESKLR